MDIFCCRWAKPCQKMQICWIWTQAWLLRCRCYQLCQPFCLCFVINLHRVSPPGLFSPLANRFTCTTVQFFIRLYSLTRKLDNGCSQLSCSVPGLSEEFLLSSRWFTYIYFYLVPEKSILVTLLTWSRSVFSWFHLLRTHRCILRGFALKWIPLVLCLTLYMRIWNVNGRAVSLRNYDTQKCAFVSVCVFCV